MCEYDMVGKACVSPGSLCRQRGVDQQGVCVSDDGCKLRVRRATVGSDNEPGERVQMKEWGSVRKGRTKWASRTDI